MSGLAEIGAVLAADVGVWSGHPDPTVSVQWLRDGAEIAGASEVGYRLVAEDDLCAVTARVTARNLAGAASIDCAPVIARYAAPIWDGLPVEDVVATVGDPSVLRDVGARISGSGGVWSVLVDGVADPARAEIDAQGVVRIHATSTLDAGAIVAGYANSGGTASVAFLASVAPAATVPGQMSAPSLASPTQSSIAAHLAADPEDGGSPVLSRDLRWTSDGATWIAQFDVASTFVIEGLAPGAAHEVQARAVNAVGAGAWSESAVAATLPAEEAPTVAASDALSGRTLAIAATRVTGQPAPEVALSALTLDGVDVLSQATGSNPWSFEVPSSGVAQTVAWTVTATNSEGTATASGSETVAADLAPPDAMSAPTLAGGTGSVTVTLAAAPADNGSAITQYDWQIDAAGGDFSNPVQEGTRTPAQRGAPFAVSLPAGDYIARSRAENAAGFGAWSAASSAATVTASASALADLVITPTRTTVREGQGVTFVLSIPTLGKDAEAELLKNAEFIWDFKENYEFTSLSTHFRGDRFSQQMRGPVGAHVFRTAGTYAVSVDAYDPVSGAKTTKTVSISVTDLDTAFPAAQTYFVAPGYAGGAAQLESDVKDGTISANMPGIVLADVPSANFIDTYPGPLSGSNRRVLFLAGASVQQGDFAYDVGNGSHVGTFGGSERFKVIAPNIITGAASAVHLWSIKGPVSDITVEGIEWEGGYDPTEKQWALLPDGSGAEFAFTLSGGAITSITLLNGGSGYLDNPDLYEVRFWEVVETSQGTINYWNTSGRASVTISDGVITGVTLVNGGSDHTDKVVVGVVKHNPYTLRGAVYLNNSSGGPSNITIFNCKSSGLYSGIMGTTDPAPLYIVNNDISNWYNYGIFFENLMQSGIIGNRIEQPLGTPEEMTGIVGEKNPKYIQYPYYPDHGPIRNQRARDGVIAQNETRAYGGWAGVQPSIRALMDGAKGDLIESQAYPGVVYDLTDLNLPASFTPEQWDDFLYSTWLKWHHSISISGNHIKGGTGLIVTTANNWTGYVRARYVTIEANFVEVNRDGNSLGVTSYYNCAVRNNIIVVPDVAFNNAPDPGKGIGIGIFGPDNPANGYPVLSGIHYPDGALGTFEDQGTPSIYNNTLVDLGSYRYYDPVADQGGSVIMFPRDWIIFGKYWHAESVVWRQDTSIELLHTINPPISFNNLAKIAPSAMFTDLSQVVEYTNLSAFGQPQAGSSALGAATGAKQAILDFRGSVRPPSRAVGALEEATSLAGWPAYDSGYAPATISVAFSKTPKPGDVISPVPGDPDADVTPVLTVLTPGTPALNPDHVTYVYKVNETSNWSSRTMLPPYRRLRVFEAITLYAEDTIHPWGSASALVKKTILATPDAGVTFPASPATYIGPGGFSAVTSGRKFTFATVLTLAEDGNDHIINSNNTGPELIRLADGRFRIRVYDTGGSKRIGDNFTLSNHFKAADGPFYIVFSADFDGGLSGGARMQFWVNGVLAASSTKLVPAGVVMGFAQLKAFGLSTSDTSPCEMHHWMWMSGTVAADVVAGQWSEFFDPITGDARALDAATATPLGWLPEVFIPADAATINALDELVGDMTGAAN